MEITFRLESLSEVGQLRDWINAVDMRSNVLTNSPISGLWLTVRAENCLFPVGIKTIGQLLTWSSDALYKLPNLGSRSLNEIKYALTKLGLTLAPTESATCEYTPHESTP
jgi:DNA-directed RNA polymerase alpha subunit